jgi:nitrogen fixation NifU-like protein
MTTIPNKKLNKKLNQKVGKSVQNLYQQALLLHHKNPVGYNQEIVYSAKASGNNSACGDEIIIKIQMDNGFVHQVVFTGDSCAICRASASMLCKSLTNTTLTQANAVLKVTLDCLAGLQVYFPENIAPLAAVKQYPVRIQCAQLPWQTLQKIALFNHELYQS